MPDSEQDRADSVVELEQLRSLDKAFSLAWQLLEREGHSAVGDEKQQRERLARIILDSMVDGHEPDASTARLAVDRYMKTPPA
jgi:hypothetical protein